MLKFESRDAPRDVCGGVELGQFQRPTLRASQALKSTHIYTPDGAHNTQTYTAGC